MADAQVGAATDPTKTAGSVKVNAPFQIQTRQTRERWLKLLVYGKPGAGKTELLASCAMVPQMGVPLVIDCESGDLTVEDNPRLSEAAQDIILNNTIKATTFSMVARIQEFMKAYCSARDRGDKATMIKLYKMVTGIDTETPPDYRTIIIDTLSEVDAYCTYQVLNVDAEKVLHDEGGMDVAGWPEFRKNYEMVKLLVRAFRDLPVHLLVSAHEQYTKDQQSRFHYTPKLTGKLAGEIQGHFDTVGWLTVGASTPEKPAPRRLFIQPVGGNSEIPMRFDAKNRRSVFQAPFMDDPNMETIMRNFKLI